MTTWQKLVRKLLAPVRWFTLLALAKTERKYRNPLYSWPRNAPCFCGGPAKFKYCCGHKMPSEITSRELRELMRKHSHLRELMEDPTALARVLA